MEPCGDIIRRVRLDQKVPCLRIKQETQLLFTGASLLSVESSASSDDTCIEDGPTHGGRSGQDVSQQGTSKALILSVHLDVINHSTNATEPKGHSV